MTKRENLISLYKRNGYEKAQISFSLCPELEIIYKEKTGSSDSYVDYFGFSHKNVSDLTLKSYDKEKYLKYYKDLKPGSKINNYGVAHEPGSEAAKHMTYMRNPLKNCNSLDEIKEYPFPEYTLDNFEEQKKQVKDIHDSFGLYTKLEIESQNMQSILFFNLH